VRRFDIEVFEDDPVLGPEDAPITIFEFSDFECPYCQRHNLEVFNRIMEAYEGQIRYVYKDFPLTAIHPNALPAAAAALCAHEQNAFWEFHDYLFSMALGLSEEAYMQYAEDLNLDMDDFTDCVEEGRYEESVQADIDFASSLGVSSTPTFFINGIIVIGAQDFEYFVQIIDGELEGGD
jgi:protein-disulfide isomerase